MGVQATTCLIDTTANANTSATVRTDDKNGHLHHFKLVAILNSISAFQAGRVFSFLNPLMPGIAPRNALLAQGIS